MDEADKRCRAFDQLKGSRTNWDTHFQTIHDYFYLEAEDINRTYFPGTELDFDYLYDTTSLNVANVLPAGIANYMTPFSGDWAAMRHRDPRRNESKKVRMWMHDATAEIFYILSNSNFYDQALPFYKDTSLYGTANMLTEDDHDDVIRFYALPIKQCYIVDDSAQRVNEYYIEFEYTAEQAVDKFGINNVGRKVKESYEKGERTDTKHKFILYIGPRYDRNPMKIDNLSMPIQALWVDYESKKTVLESGYELLPAFTHRFHKRPGMAYGFSPAMLALADVRWINAMAKTELRSAMKIADPAMALPDNAFILPLDLNNRALNYYKDGSLDDKKIFPIGNGGNVQVNELMLEKKIQNLKEHMFYDVFLAFQGITKQMTVPEVMQRANERMTLLGPAVGRFQSDVLDNLFHITLNKAFKAGRLPELPDELIDDPTYEIEYTSVLALAQKSKDLTSLQTALAMTGEMAQFNPEVLDKIDFDRAMDSIWGNTGADPSVLNDAKEVDAVRQMRAQMQEQQAQMEQLAQGAQTAKTVSEAERNLRGNA